MGTGARSSALSDRWLRESHRAEDLRARLPPERHPRLARGCGAHPSLAGRACRSSFHRPEPREAARVHPPVEGDPAEGSRRGGHRDAVVRRARATHGRAAGDAGLPRTAGGDAGLQRRQLLSRRYAFDAIRSGLRRLRTGRHADDRRGPRPSLLLHPLHAGRCREVLPGPRAGERQSDRHHRVRRRGEKVPDPDPGLFYTKSLSSKPGSINNNPAIT